MIRIEKMLYSLDKILNNYASQVCLDYPFQIYTSNGNYAYGSSLWVYYLYSCPNCTNQITLSYGFTSLNTCFSYSTSNPALQDGIFYNIWQSYKDN